MEKEQIKKLIAAGIKGQGTNVDGGGVLGTILEEIVNLISDSEESPIVINGTRDDNGDFVPASGAISFLEASRFAVDGKRLVFKLFNSQDDVQCVSESWLLYIEPDYSPYFIISVVADDESPEWIVWKELK